MPLEYYYASLLVPIAFIDLYLCIRYRSLIARNARALTGTILFLSVPYYFLIDSTAIHVFKLWAYDEEKILGHWVLGTTLEEFIWVFLVVFFTTTIMLVVKEHLNKAR